jgi:predicted XRE-type DNA-binding protein
MIEVERFDSIWDAIEDTPAEALHMKLCADLMSQVRQIIVESGWSAGTAAGHLGVAPDRVDDLLHGRIDRFQLDELVRMTGTLGRKLRIEIEAA